MKCPYYYGRCNFANIDGARNNTGKVVKGLKRKDFVSLDSERNFALSKDILVFKVITPF